MSEFERASIADLLAATGSQKDDMKLVRHVVTDVLERCRLAARIVEKINDLESWQLGTPNQGLSSAVDAAMFLMHASKRLSDCEEHFEAKPSHLQIIGPALDEIQNLRKNCEWIFIRGYASRPQHSPRD